jgi:hypothetical protein
MSTLCRTLACVKILWGKAFCEAQQDLDPGLALNMDLKEALEPNFEEAKRPMADQRKIP